MSAEAILLAIKPLMQPMGTTMNARDDAVWVADTITRQKAEIERLRAALKAVVDGAYEMEYEPGYMLTDHSYKAAVSALSFEQNGDGS